MQIQVAKANIHSVLLLQFYGILDKTSRPLDELNDPQTSGKRQSGTHVGLFLLPFSANCHSKKKIAATSQFVFHVVEPRAIRTDRNIRVHLFTSFQLVELRSLQPDKTYSLLTLLTEFILICQT